MPARLVYSPKTYVYTKDQAGTVYNLTPYVTAGQVQRKINQVSTAEVTLRNPYKYFTGGQGQPRIFHPMDPITIYLERIKGFPVRVFTGYLDTTPYYQMYPGTITIQASCTLKRLLYTYFDPSLPYVIAFFTKYGWFNTGSGSIISAKAFDGQLGGASQADVNAGKKPFNKLQDGSLAKLLWAILFDIGEWQDTNIYVEDLPTGSNGIAQRMQKLMQSMQQDQQNASNDFTAFLEGVIGAGAQGSGGGNATASGNPGSTGNVTDVSKIVPTMVAIANSYGLPPLFVVTVWLAEGEVTNSTPNSSKAVGYFQFTSSTPYPGITVNYPKDATDLGIATNAFCKAASQMAANGHSNISGSIPAGFNKNDQTQWETWAETVQNPGAGAYSSYWSSRVASARSLISQYANQASVGQAISGAVSGAANAIGQAVTGAGAGIYSAPFASGSGVQLARTDEGVDFSGTGVQVHAIGDAVVTGYSPSGFEGVVFTYRLSAGDHSGMEIYVNEGIAIDPALQHQGAKIQGGQVIGTIQNMGTVAGASIEIGFWANGGPYKNTDAVDGQPYSTAPGRDGRPTVGGWQFTNFLNSLGQATAQKAPASFGGGTGNGGGSTTGAGGATGGVSSTSTAQAFVAELNFPSMEDMVTAVALGAEHKGLMHDQSLMPFVQQVAQASMRSFQSLPNGDFYAFYPDYFGEMGHHKPYWMIHDIEILSGGINLTDDALATHVFAVGDNTWPVNQELLNMLFSAGSINVFNAFLTNGIIDTSVPKGTKQTDMSTLMQADEAVKFIERYGARPLVQDYPMVRSPIFEMLLAYQQFLFAWSNQFKTPFTFTFMPELFPGGKVGFPEHGIQMYINSVTHSWNYQEGGFTTTAELSAPSLLEGATAADWPDIPPNMVEAIIEPVRKGPTGSQGSSNPKVKQGTQAVANTVDQSVQQVFNGLDNILGIAPH